MNEIEKMYENAGIKCLHPSGFCKHIGAICEVCERHKYPPFTAEKQLKLTQKLWELKPNVYPNFDLLTDYYYGEMIAELANNLWQDLTPEEKQQIKEILE